MVLGNADPPENLCKIIDLQSYGTPEYYKHNYTNRLEVSNGLNGFLHTRGCVNVLTYECKNVPSHNLLS